MRLVVFDLDDTLLSSENTVSERNRNAIIKCNQKGMKIGYITARSKRMMSSFLSGLPCDCLANYNGATIIADDQLLETNHIPYLLGMKLIRYTREVSMDVGVAAYFEPYCYKNKRIRHYLTQDILDYDIDSVPAQDFQRIRIFPNGCELDRMEFQNEELQVQTSNNDFLITNKHANKGVALEKLMNYYHVGKEQVISFGDGISDIPMMKLSGTAVAMENAMAEVKDIADYVTLSNDEDGVAEYIEKFLL